MDVKVTQGNPYIVCLITQADKYALTRLGLYGSLLPTEISWNCIEIKWWAWNYLHMKLSSVITHPCHNFKSDLAKPSQYPFNCLMSNQFVQYLLKTTWMNGISNKWEDDKPGNLRIAVQRNVTDVWTFFTRNIIGTGFCMTSANNIASDARLLAGLLRKLYINFHVGF